MKHLLQLATLTINLEDVGEIEQQGENFLILFGPDHVPDKMLVTDLDAALLLDFCINSLKLKAAQADA